VRFRPGLTNGFWTSALACQGPESGEQEMSMVFADTPYDEEPCDVGVDAEEDPEAPGVLHVTISATVGDDCDEGDAPPMDGGCDLPDDDGDGDGDLPAPGEDDGTSGGARPLSATASFDLIQG
jgi:hypothetical protein